MRILSPVNETSDVVPKSYTDSQALAHEHAQNVTRLFWSGTAYDARPADAEYVEFVGPVAPTGMLPGDVWLNTAAYGEAVIRVLHDGNSYPPRPVGAAYVEWVGPTPPTGQIQGDTWINTA